MATYAHAGCYDQKSWPNQHNKLTPFGSVGIYTDQATTTLALLYEDRDRNVAAANPVTLDVNGNNPEFFAEPDDYYAARITNGTPGIPVIICVDVDAEDAVDETGLMDLRGSYDASSNLFPAAGGSGTAGAVLKGDTWIISVAGTLGGQLVGVGDQLLALVDTPGQTASNWQIIEHNIGYVPANDSLVVHLAGTETITGTKNFATVRELHPRVDVTHPMFGATGLGFPTDDRDAIYNAMVYAAANGGTVYFPPPPIAGLGYYYIGSNIDFADATLVNAPLHLMGGAGVEDVHAFQTAPRVSLHSGNGYVMFSATAANSRSITFENLDMFSGTGAARCLQMDENYLITLKNCGVTGNSATHSPVKGVNNFWWTFEDRCTLRVNNPAVAAVEFESTGVANAVPVLTRFTDAIFAGAGVRIYFTGASAGASSNGFLFDNCGTENFATQPLLRIDSDVGSPQPVNLITMIHPAHFDQTGTCPYIQLNDNVYVGAATIINGYPNASAIEVNDTAILWSSKISGTGTLTPKSGAVNSSGIPTGDQIVERIGGFDLVGLFALNGSDDTDLQSRGGGVLRAARSGDRQIRFMLDRDGAMYWGPGGAGPGGATYDATLLRSGVGALALTGTFTSSGLVTASAGVTLAASQALTLNAGNIVTDTTTGTKIGTATTQKLGFFNATPVVQQLGTSDILASLVTLGLRAASSNPPLNMGTGTLTAANAVIEPVSTLFVLRQASANVTTGYALQSSGTDTYVNGVTNLLLRISNTSVVTLTSALVTVFQPMLLANSANIQLGTGAGTQLGTSAAQKLGFWGKTPIVQPTTAITAAAFVANTSGIANDTATFGGYTIGKIAAALIASGILT